MRCFSENSRFQTSSCKLAALLATLFFSLHFFSCQSGETNQEGDVPDEEQVDDERYAEEPVKKPVPIAGINLVEYDSAVPRCLQRQISGRTFEAVCHTGVKSESGEVEYLATGYGDSVREVKWSDPKTRSGAISQLSCTVSKLGLRQICKFEVNAENTILDFDLKIVNATSGEERTDTATVLAAYSIEQSAGLVPFMPSVFRRPTAKVESKIEGFSLSGIEDKELKLGLEDKALNPLSLGLRVSAMCSQGDTLFFAHGVSIFTIGKDGLIRLYAGSVSPQNYELLRNRRSVYLGKVVDLECVGKDIFALTTQMYFNQGRHFARVLKIAPQGPVQVLVGGENNPNDPDPTKKPTGFGIDAIGADIRGANGMSYVDLNLMYLTTNRTDLKLVKVEDNKAKLHPLPLKDDGEEDYGTFSDVLVDQGDIYLAAQGDHKVYRLDGSILRIKIGDGTSNPVVGGTDLDLAQSPIAGPRKLYAYKSGLLVTTSWNSVEFINKDGVVATLFGNYDQPSTGPFPYVLNANPSLSRGQVESVAAYEEKVAISGNGVIRLVDNAQMSVLAGIAGFTDFDPKDLKGDAIESVLPQIKAAIPSQSGGLYLLDALNTAMYSVDPKGDITHFAGQKGSAVKTGSNPKSVFMPDPVAIGEFSNGDVLYALKHEIYKVVKNGGVVHFAGSNTADGLTADGVDAKLAKIGSVTDLVINGQDVYFSEEVGLVSLSVGHRIMKIDAQGRIYRIATATSFNEPHKISVAQDGSLIVIEKGTDRILKVVANSEGTLSSSSSVEVLLENFKGSDIAVAPNGKVFALEGFDHLNGSKVVALRQNNASQYEVISIYGDYANPECGSGFINGSISKDDFLKKINGSLSYVCSGDKFNSISFEGTCQKSDDSFSMVVVQNFSFDAAYGYGNVIKIRQPCSL